MANFENATFGNRSGSHQLLASSLPTSAPVLDALRFLVDRPAGHVGAEVTWSPYWGCQGIEDWWVLWRGEEDLTAPRKNMVAVNVVLVPKVHCRTLASLDEILVFLGHIPCDHDDARILRLARAVANCLASAQGPALVLDLSLAPQLLAAIWPRLWASARASLCLRTLFGIESLDSVPQSTIVLIPSELRPRWQGRRFMAEDAPDGPAGRWFANSVSPIMARIMELNAGRLPGDFAVLERVVRIVSRLENMHAGMGTLADALVVVRTQEAFSDGFVLPDADLERLISTLRLLEHAAVSDVRTASLVRLDALPDRSAVESALTRWVVARLPDQSPDDAWWLLEQQAGETHSPWWRRAFGRGVAEGCRPKPRNWATAIWRWWQARPETVPLVMRHLDHTDEIEEWLASSVPPSVGGELVERLAEVCRSREWAVLLARALGPRRPLAECVSVLQRNLSHPEAGLGDLLLDRSPSQVVDAAASTSWPPLIARAVGHTRRQPDLIARALGSKGLIPLLLGHLSDGGKLPGELLTKDFTLQVLMGVLEGNADHIKIAGYLDRTAGAAILDYPEADRLLPLVGSDAVQGAADEWWRRFLADESIGRPPSALCAKVLVSARRRIDWKPITLVIRLLLLFPEITEATFEEWVKDTGFHWERGAHHRLASLLVERSWKSATKSMRWSWKNELKVVAWHARELLPWYDIPWTAPDGADEADPSLSPISLRKTMKVLFLAANPAISSRLALDEEARSIEHKVRDAKYRDSVDMRTRWAVRPDDLQQALLEIEPSVVHFSGHGGGPLGILMHSSDPAKESLVSAEALADLFRVLKGGIRVVVLNACYSETQARAIVAEVDFVVGMSDSIGDEAARVFAAAFYRGLAFGHSVGKAFDLGMNELKLMGLNHDVSIPQLLVRPGVDAGTTVLVTGSPS